MVLTGNNSGGSMEIYEEWTKKVTYTKVSVRVEGANRCASNIFAFTVCGKFDELDGKKDF